MEKEGVRFYWALLETPIIIFLIYSLINLVIPFTDFLGLTFASILSIAVLLFVFIFSSYKSVSEKKGKPVKAGVYSGVFMGLISAIIGILTYYLYPGRFAEAIQKAVSAGAGSGITQTMIQVGLFTNIIFLPIFYAAVGALIAWLSSYAFKSKKSSKK